MNNVLVLAYTEDFHSTPLMEMSDWLLETQGPMGDDTWFIERPSTDYTFKIDWMRVVMFTFTHDQDAVSFKLRWAEYLLTA